MFSQKNIVCPMLVFLLIFGCAQQADSAEAVVKKALDSIIKGDCEET